MISKFIFLFFKYVILRTFHTFQFKDLYFLHVVRCKTFVTLWNGRVCFLTWKKIVFFHVKTEPFDTSQMVRFSFIFLEQNVES